MKKVLVLMIIIMVFVFGIEITAKADCEKERKMNLKQRKIVENEYLEEIKQILSIKGYKNAGITLTYRTDMEGNIKYTVTLYHERISHMKEQEFLLLQTRIQDTAEDMFLGEIILKQMQL